MLQAFILNSIIIGICITIHYEVLNALAQFLPRIRHHRILILVSVVGVMVAHVIEIWVFGSGFLLMVSSEGFGQLRGNINNTLLDCVYFSFTNYTTLGYGDIEPIGNIRFLAGLEALTGLVLITWSASFIFIEMQRYWRK